jgi:hypothetical protein
MEPMSMRLVAAAKGLAVGVLTLGISGGGAFAYLTWRSSGCPAEHPQCHAGMEALGELAEGAMVLFALLLTLGPLFARAFRLPHPARYLIPPVLALLFACLVIRQHVGLNGLIPFVAYPVIAALSAGERREVPAPEPSSGGAASP